MLTINGIKSKHLLWLIIVTQLFGCATSKQLAYSPYEPQSFEVKIADSNAGSATAYLKLASQNASPAREDYLLTAVSKLISEHAIERAEQILNTIHVANLPGDLAYRKQLTQAHLYIMKNDTKAAMNALAQIHNPNRLQEKYLVQYHRLLALCYKNFNDPMRVVEQRLKLDQMLSDDEAKIKNRQKLWEELLKIDSVELQLAKLEAEPNSIFTGWVELALLSHSSKTPIQLSKSLKSWMEKYPQHPAAGLLEENEQNVKNVNQVALLLPLTGQLAKPAQAIRDGFMSERFTSNQSMNVRVYDTTNDDINAIYNQAIQDGNQIIIGPLSKPNVNKLIDNYDSRTPVLTLNYSDRNSAKPNLYEFGLSPLDEVQQVAAYGWQHGYRNIMVIAPEGSWGEFITKNFEETWVSFGGKILGTWLFNKNQNYNETIKNFLNLNDSYNRIKQVKQVIQNFKLKSTPRRRQDIDMIFVLAYPSEMHHILPLLRFYYANDVDIMSISMAYLPGAPQRINRDLNGLIFCDMPWVFKHDESKYYQYSKSWPEHYNQYIRLYALGHDAFKLAEAIPRLPVLPSFALNGSTGYLRIDESNHVRRQLQWAKVKNGKAEPIG